MNLKGERERERFFAVISYLFCHHIRCFCFFKLKIHEEKNGDRVAKIGVGVEIILMNMLMVVFREIKRNVGGKRKRKEDQKMMKLKLQSDIWWVKILLFLSFV